MLNKPVFVAAIVLAGLQPAWASHKEVPNLSGTYAYTVNAACWSFGAPSFAQQVGTETFDPATGIGKLASGSNTLVAGSPVHSQRNIGISQHYEVLSEHKITLGGGKAYVQFGAVRNGIATLAYLLSTNGDRSCTFQTVFTQTAP